MYTEEVTTPNSALPMFPEGHYMMSESVMGHIYESIADDDIVRARYDRDYQQYSLMGREEDPPGTVKSVALPTYDKLDKSSSLKTAPYNVLNRREKSTQERPSSYETLELQASQEDRGYNKLQRKKHEAKQLTDKEEDYEQIDFYEDFANN